MKQMNKPLVFIFLLICSVAANAQIRQAICRVSPLWKAKDISSATLKDIDKFNLDVKEGQTIRSFKWDEGLILTVGVKFEFDYSNYPKKKPPYYVQLAINTSSKEEKEVFDSFDSSEAKTLYKKNWNLAVTKKVKFYDRIYLFTIRCGDGLKMIYY